MDDWWGSLFDVVESGGSEWWTDFAAPVFDVPDFDPGFFDVPAIEPDYFAGGGMDEWQIDTSSWVYDSATGNIVDASQWMVVNESTLNAAVDSGVMPDVSSLPMIDSTALVNSANSTFISAGPGGWYDTATGMTYAPDGSVIDAAGTFIEKGSSFILPDSNSLLNLVKAGWAELSKYKVTSTADGRTVLIPRAQVSTNGVITSGPYAGQQASSIAGVNSGFAGLSSSLLLPLGIGALALFSSMKGN